VDEGLAIGVVSDHEMGMPTKPINRPSGTRSGIPIAPDPLPRERHEYQKLELNDAPRKTDEIDLLNEAGH
jgi:hypothetical protein